MTTDKRVRLLMKATDTEGNQAEFGRVAGVGRATVNQWLYADNTRSINSEAAFRLSDKTGMSARWVALGEGPQKDLSAKFGKFDESDLDVLADLSELLYEDAADFKAKIRNAAEKARRYRQKEPDSPIRRTGTR
jgi:hypothetical protein